jgi:2-polyprenyl-3-methyl-5-hydroxy-6-metoxy-1,4-benzoquinol methylase
MSDIGAPSWNDEMFLKHPTPYTGLAGIIERYRAKRILDVIKGFKKDKFTLVEVGCEAGNLIKYISDRLPNGEYIGIDISKTALERARELLKPQIRLVEHDITAANSLELGNIDFLICSETLEHIPKVKDAILGLSKIAGPRTIVIITVPFETLKNRIKSFFLKIGAFNLFLSGIETQFSEWHVHDFSKDDMSRLLSACFTILKYRRILYLHQMIILKKT